MKNRAKRIFAVLNDIKIPDCLQSAKQNNISKLVLVSISSHMNDIQYIFTLIHHFHLFQ